MPASSPVIDRLNDVSDAIYAAMLASPAEDTRAPSGTPAGVVRALLDAVLGALADGPPRAPEGRMGALERLLVGADPADAMEDVFAWISTIRGTLAGEVQALAAGAEEALAAILRLDEACDEVSRGARALLRRALGERREAQELAIARGRALFERTPAMMFAVDSEMRIVAASDRLLATLGFTREELLGRRSVEFATEASKRRALEHNMPLMSKQGFVHDSPMQLIKKNGEVLEVLLSSAAFKGPSEHDVQLCTALFDITDRMLVIAQEQTIVAQEELLRTLSAPIVPLDAGVLAMPLVGRITAERAQRLFAGLAEEVVARAARVVIVDVTGVSEADAAVAAAIVAAAQALRLLGAEVVLSGVGPAMAQTLVELGTELGGITTLGTLQDGIAYAARRTGRDSARLR